MQNPCDIYSYKILYQYCDLLENTPAFQLVNTSFVLLDLLEHLWTTFHKLRTKQEMGTETRARCHLLWNKIGSYEPKWKESLNTVSQPISLSNQKTKWNRNDTSFSISWIKWSLLQTPVSSSTLSERIFSCFYPIVTGMRMRSFLTAKPLQSLPRWFCSSRVCPSSVGVMRSHIKLFIFSSPL